jgi:uncharacterized protein YqfA (UPF0365 family)
LSVNPKVIETPVVGRHCQGRIELRAKASSPVRAILSGWWAAGGRVRHRRVGRHRHHRRSPTSHKAVLENPDIISRTGLAKGLDDASAFEFLSIDIADVRRGRNIARRCRWIRRSRKAHLPRPRRRAPRDGRRPREGDEVRLQEMRTKVWRPRAKCPRDGSALRDGKLGVMDYFQMQNSSRHKDARSIADTGAPQPKSP